MKIFSIITPTLNSASTIRYYLDSIIKQDYDLSKIEILIIDGGSTDMTLSIAMEYSVYANVRIINNPHRMPEYAKCIGINSARGKYCVFQDSDEALVNRNSFRIREEIFNRHNNVNTLILTKLVNPPGYSKWGEYYSSIGDPFSSYVYGPAFSYLEKFGRYYKKEEYSKYIICEVAAKKIMPLIDGVQTFRRDKLLKLINKNVVDTSDVSNISYILINSSSFFAVTKDDDVLHYASSSCYSITKKIRSRIIRNVFGDDDAGFMSRVDTIPSWYRYKRYLFLPYAFFVLPAMIDGVKYSIKTKNIIFMLHFYLAFFTAFEISWNIFLKLFGVNKKNTRFG